MGFLDNPFEDEVYESDLDELMEENMPFQAQEIEVIADVHNPPDSDDESEIDPNYDPSDDYETDEQDNEALIELYENADQSDAEVMQEFLIYPASEDDSISNDSFKVPSFAITNSDSDSSDPD